MQRSVAKSAVCGANSGLGENFGIRYSAQREGELGELGGFVEEAAKYRTGCSGAAHRGKTGVV